MTQIIFYSDPFHTIRVLFKAYMEHLNKGVVSYEYGSQKFFENGPDFR